MKDKKIHIPAKNMVPNGKGVIKITPELKEEER